MSNLSDSALAARRVSSASALAVVSVSSASAPALGQHALGRARRLAHAALRLGLRAGEDVVGGLTRGGDHALGLRGGRLAEPGGLGLRVLALGGRLLLAQPENLRQPRAEVVVALGGFDHAAPGLGQLDAALLGLVDRARQPLLQIPDLIA
ncbi:hypothetical protein [Nonomuraea dietziae]|uniref:hypothetical protein n=1 Tax=Nonomuraea dietziae TaxID=65515 RepID=UPI0031D8DD55